MGVTTDLKSLGNVRSNFFSRPQIDGRLRQRNPDAFIEKEGLRVDTEFERLQLADVEKAHLARINGILTHPALQGLIEAGKITVGLIKPHVNKGRPDMSDDEIADDILNSKIQKPLQVIFSLPIWITPAEVENFYSVHKARFSSLKDDQGTSTVWDRLTSYMTSGAVTFVLIYSPDGNAVPEWRRQIGPTNPAADTARTTIRGRFGFDVRHNVVHGSDSTENVREEIAWMQKKIDRLLNPVEIGADDLLTEEKLRQCNVLEQDEIFLGVEQFLPTQQVGRENASFSAYIVTFIDSNGHIVRRRFVTKDRPSGKDSVENEVGRFLSFQELIDAHPIDGINSAPPVYHVGQTTGGTGRFVREYVPDHTASMRRIVLNPEFDISLRKSMVESLAETAALLDSNGIRSKRMCEAFIYTGTGHTYVGSSNIDFTNRSATQVEDGLADVLAIYGEDEVMSAYIKEVYSRVKSVLLQASS